MSNAINTAVATFVETKAVELKDKRIAWEEGAFKRSNEELYSLLEDCLSFYTELKGNVQRCAALNDHLRANEIQFNEGASLETRIVRAVFNSSFQKRAYAYARVIKIAADEKPAGVSMSKFITDRKGIEELRRTKQNGKTPSQQRKDDIAYATEMLSKCAPITPSFSVDNSTVTFEAGATHNLFVAVVRQEADGSYSIVHETSTNAVVNAALAQAGKTAGAKAQAAAEDAQRLADAENSTDALAAATEAAQPIAA